MHPVKKPRLRSLSILHLRFLFLFTFAGSSPPVKNFTRPIVFVFLLASSLFVVPKDLIHELTHHEDTADAFCAPGDELSLSAEHHHCESLQLYTPPCTPSDGAFQFHEISILLSRQLSNSPAASFDIADSFSIRGPPSPPFSC